MSAQKLTPNTLCKTAGADSILQILGRSKDADPDKAALLAPGRTVLTRGALWAQFHYVGHALVKAGIRRGDRVAVVLPDGPELAVAFLTVSCCATFAPLNPAYRTEHFDFYLGDLKAKAVILPAGEDCPARAVAEKRGIPIFELTTDAKAPAGQFVLNSEPQVPSWDETGFAGPDDVALVLHTSGTTSRPKMVPLTQRNLCCSARNIATALALTPDDRGLCVMPLFHIHGLIGALLSSVVAGASVMCAPGFSADHFFAWLDEFKPSWFTAVPTMHQAIIASAAKHAATIRRNPMRLVRSSSAALPVPLLLQLEEAFGVPVIESYGMTEASHQMTSNPLPPRARKPGSVGLAAGPEVAIMDEAGQFLAAGTTGEVAIRGPNVTHGYDNDPAANARAFTNGWLRTGDQGHLDVDGYLFITGRLKEIINRGGEKIAPQEIDGVLLTHPSVQQAVAFAVPHPSLGEDVYAAVVLHTGLPVAETALREFALARLLPAKVPTRIVVVNEIPRGPTGKIQRKKMAAHLAPALATAYEAPASKTETLIAKTIETVLGRSQVGRNDNFFALGGDSLRAVQVMARLRPALAIEIPVFLLFQYPTPAVLALELERRIEEVDLAALAAELEKLSPEEIDRLLGDPIR